MCALRGAKTTIKLPVGGTLKEMARKGEHVRGVYQQVGTGTGSKTRPWSLEQGLKRNFHYFKGRKYILISAKKSQIIRASIH